MVLVLLPLRPWEAASKFDSAPFFIFSLYYYYFFITFMLDKELFLNLSSYYIFNFFIILSYLSTFYS